MRQFTSLRVLGVAVILWGAGVYAVNNRGYASCVPATGVSGLMNKVLFAPAADCILTQGNTGGCFNLGAACTFTPVTGKAKPGKCQTVDRTCTCIAK